jgi:hypothetical protein
MLVRVLICARCAARTGWGTGVLALLALSLNCFAADITLGWKPSSDPNVVGYNVYYGVASGTYTNVVDAGPATSVTIPSLVPGTTYFFAATSYDLSGLEGLFSPEMSYTIPSTPPDNQPPTLDPIGDLTINENTAAQSINLTGISSGISNNTQTLSITAVSSDLTIIPSPTVSYSSPSPTATLMFTPTPNAYGVATITVTLDNGLPTNNTTVRSFTITVDQVSSPPMLQITASAPGTLTALGNVGTSYQVQFATNLLPTLVWHPLLTFTQTNASQTLNVGMPNSVILYRLLQQ